MSAIPFLKGIETQCEKNIDGINIEESQRIGIGEKNYKYSDIILGDTSSTSLSLTASSSSSSTVLSTTMNKSTLLQSSSSYSSSSSTGTNTILVAVFGRCFLGFLFFEHF